MNIKEKKRLKKRVYKDIYKIVKHKIYHAYDHGKKDCYYIFPDYIPGFPILDKIECISYIIQKIRKRGHKCKYIHPMILYITIRTKSI